MAAKTANRLQTTFRCISLNVVLSLITVLLCAVHSFYFDGLLRVGKLYSPTVFVVLVAESVRWTVNRFTFNLDASARDMTISSSRSSNSKRSILRTIKNQFIFCALLVTFVVSFALICVLMGASYHSNYEETLTLAAVLTAFTIFPIGLFLGPKKSLQYLFYDTFELPCHQEVEHLEFLQTNAIAALIGAWAGSVVAPLDWDRDWQAYPIPNVVGAVAGYGLANCQTLVYSVFRIGKDEVHADKKST